MSAHKILAYLFLAFAFSSNYLVGQDTRLSNLTWSALLDQGQVFIGTIDGPLKPSISGGLPTVEVRIEEYLRGVKIVGGKINLKVDSTVEMGLHPPRWLGTVVQPGRRILVVMSSSAGADYPERVLDLDSSDGKILLPIVRRILAADDRPPQERKTELTKALNDPSSIVRKFAEYRLRTHPQPTEIEGVEKFNATIDAAFTGNTQDRVAAIKKLADDVYDASKPNGVVSPHIRYVLAQLLLDSNPTVREESIIELSRKVFAVGAPSVQMMNEVKNNPELKAKLVAQLKKDVDERPSYAEQAGQLLCVMDRNADQRCTARGFNNKLPARSASPSATK